jgi:hypothetical protein
MDFSVSQLCLWMPQRDVKAKFSFRFEDKKKPCPKTGALNLFSNQTSSNEKQYDKYNYL